MCVAAAPTRWIVDQVEGAYASAVFAGIVPDRRHLDNGGYHVCLTHLWGHGNADDYSNTRTLDESPPVTVAGRQYSAAFDISLSPADMKRLHARVRRVFLDRTDPRRRWINAVNCWDGTGDAVRYDFQANTTSWASPDHKSHTHGDQPRLYVDMTADAGRCWRAARAFASVMVGEARAAWDARQGVGNTDSGEDDMTPGELLDTQVGRSGPSVGVHLEQTRDTVLTLPAKLDTIIAAVAGDDVLARLDEIEAASAARDADLRALIEDLRALVQQAQSGQLAADKVVQLMGERLTVVPQA